MLLEMINLVSFSQLFRLRACTVKSSLTLFRGVLVILFYFLSTLSFAAPSIESRDLVLDQIPYAMLPSVLDANLPVIDLNYKPIELDRLVASLPSMKLIDNIEGVNDVDVTPPELVSLEISPREVDVTDGKQTVFVNVSVRDESGVDFTSFWLRFPELGLYKSTYTSNWSFNEESQLYETSVSFILDKTVIGGTWAFSVVGDLEDKLGNSTSQYNSPEKLVELGFYPYLSVTNLNEVDITPPELVSLTIEQQEVDVTFDQQTINVHLGVRDESGVGFTSFWLRFPELGLYKSTYTSNWTFNEESQLYETSVSFFLDKTVIGGTWAFSVVGDLEDKLGNSTSEYNSAEKLVELGFYPYLSVTNLNEVDTTPPELVSLIIEQKEVDVTFEQQTIDVHLGVRDESGVGFTSFWIRFPELGRYKSTYISNWTFNEESNLYEASVSFILDKTAIGGTWAFSVVGDLEDKLGNRTSQYSAAEKLVGLGFSPYITVVNGIDTNLFDSKVEPSRDYSQVTTYQKALFYLSLQNNKEYDVWIYANDVTRLTGVRFTGAKSVSNACSISNLTIQCRISSSSDLNKLTAQVSSYTLDVSRYSIYMVLKPVGEPFESDWSSNYARFPALDVDGDGINNDVDLDDDNDGLSDEEELVLGTNPFWKDTDGDGIDDNIEVENSLDPLDASDALADFDGDGINNADEIALGTNVNLSDSDGDGVDDGVEVANGSDPLNKYIQVGSLTNSVLFSDVNQDAVADWIKYTTHSNRVEVSLFSGSNYNALANYVIENSFDSPVTIILNDRDADGINEVGVFGFDASANRYQLQVHSGLTGVKQDVWNWPATLGEVQFEALADLTGDGIQEYAISGVHLANGTRQLVVKDGVTKATYQTFKWPNLWDAPQFVTMSDVTFDSVPEVALYGRHSRLDKGQLFIYDGANADSKVDVYNWNKLWDNVQLIEMDDLDGDSTIDWGQFGQRIDDGRYQWVVKKGSDKRGVIRTFTWPNDLVDVAPILVADRTGDGIREVAISGINPDDGKVFIRINDGRLPNERIANISWPASWEDYQVMELGDLNNDGFSEFGLLGFTKANRSLQLVIRDGASLAEYGRVSIAGWWENVSVSYDPAKNRIVMLGIDQKTANNTVIEIEPESLQITQQYQF
ncbi:hypothetical protein [Shewanella ulleungensis]|uniref:hypothetical protein n=2 Tax=Shewanella ulleungensis TaxID=2282699 RepID=UPI00201003CE|nr:hypothetical protein [Shewanella ulleungensis]MCL1150864.1 hypothetical protein [Shewanella ulleungensis]